MKGENNTFEYICRGTNIQGAYTCNHDYNKILKSDWLSTALISALIGQFNRTVLDMNIK